MHITCLDLRFCPHGPDDWSAEVQLATVGDKALFLTFQSAAQFMSDTACALIRGGAGILLSNHMTQLVVRDPIDTDDSPNMSISFDTLKTFINELIQECKKPTILGHSACSPDTCRWIVENLKEIE